MEGVPNINASLYSEPVDVQPSRSPRPTTPATARPHDQGDTLRAEGDRVELSEKATFMARIRDLPDIRVEKVAELRAQIDAGVYETPDKIEFVANLLLREIA